MVTLIADILNKTEDIEESNNKDTIVYGYIATEPVKQPIPKDKQGRVDILAMQHSREESTGIPKQTEDERHLQAELDDAFR